MPTAIIHHPVCAKHDTGEGHPESPARYEVVMNALRADMELWPKLLEFEANEAARGDVHACHASQHFKNVQRVVREGTAYLAADSVVSLYFYDAALPVMGASSC